MLAPSAATNAEIRAIADSLVAPELILFPVRHHSPACAWRLDALFETHRPSRVLVEGPRCFTKQIPLLTHEAARMPLAVYTYAVMRTESDEPAARRAAYYPFCDYSPELVALRAARRLGLDASFIDLDFAEQCQIERPDEDTEPHSLLDERRFKRSRFLTALAQQLGCRNHEELWEHLFEASAASVALPEFLAAMTAYCHLARVEYSAEELQRDGTLAREAEMAWHVREALAKRAPNDGPVLVVLGGFHAVAMPRLLASPTPRPVVSRSNVADEAAAVIRYSFDRLDRLNGYSAGMTSPAWHQRLWERMQTRAKAGVDTGARVRSETTLAMIFDVADRLREKHGLALPVPTLTAAYEQALLLAELRRRSAPLREDLLDGITSCFVKGDIDAEGALVLSVAHQVLSGQASGKAPAGAERPPLVKDFEQRARRQRLKIDDSDPRRSVLDIYRRKEHRATSRLFHGLALLGVPLATRTAGPDFVAGFGLDALQEHWQYAYSAGVEGALVEASVYGVTVPLAVAARFTERLSVLESGPQANDARLAAALTVQACVLGLHEHLPRVLGNVRRALGNDAAFDSVANAVFSLGLLWEAREPLEAHNADGLPALIQAAYERTIYLGHDLRSARQEGELETLKALARLRELLVSAAGRVLDASLFYALVDELRSAHGSALIRGGCAGLAFVAGRLSDDELAVAVTGHLNGLAQPRDAVGFLRGLLYCAREAAWQRPQLIRALDALLRDWNEAAFLAALPELRLAFAEMTPSETDRIAQAVGALHGGTSLGALMNYDISADEVAQHLDWSRGVADVLKADGLSLWLDAAHG